jgi:hypothetical protein
MGNFEEYRKTFRQLVDKGVVFPEISRLKSIEELQDLRLIGCSDDDVYMSFKYEAVAPELFPAVRQRLIDLGVAKIHNMCDTSLGQDGNRYRVHMGFYGNKLQIMLDLYKERPKDW